MSAIWSFYLASALGWMGVANPPGLVAGDASCTPFQHDEDLVAFVAAQTGYPKLRTCPTLRATDLDELGRSIGGGLQMQGETPRAIYVLSSGEVLVGPDFDVRTVLDRSFLVHELVHVSQVRSGASQQGRCPGWLEGEAYRVQAYYLRRHGRPRDAFQFELLGFLQSACGHFYAPMPE